jgi:hypothetical protein
MFELKIIVLNEDEELKLDMYSFKDASHVFVRKKNNTVAVIKDRFGITKSIDSSLDQIKALILKSY